MKLWIRKLSCGHERPTNIAFLSGIYKKPKVGDSAYCRECFEEVKIVGVEESDDELKENIKRFKKVLK